jgi:D-glycero-D-manno-heptose 1,7-bisphosphate phosphatase
MDRDGTINEEIGYVLRPGELRLIPGAAEAIRRLRELGLGIVIVTNQSPVGRGWITPAELDAIHDRLRELLLEHGAEVDAIEACPHAPDEGCGCRKPATGLVRRAASALGFDPSASFVVGDHAGDMAMGRSVGASTIFVLTGHGDEERAAAEAFADHVVEDLPAAAELIGRAISSRAP